MKTTKWQLWGRGLICLMALAAAIFYWDTLCEILGGIRQISAVGFCVSILLSAAAYVVEGMTISLMAGAGPKGDCDRTDMRILPYDHIGKRAGYCGNTLSA